MIKAFTLSIFVVFLSAIQVKSQSACNYWKQRDASFHIVPFASSNPPYYRNDDDYATINLPFNFCFWGQTMTTVYININGNVTFTPAGLDYTFFTADTFPQTSSVVPPMIAPFWADVDTKDNVNYAYVGSDVISYQLTSTHLIVQWDSVGYVGQQWCIDNSIPYGNDSLNNSFQLILTDGNDPILPQGNNVEFYYDRMQWTTGGDSPDCSGHGFFGDPANVGANEGDGVRSIQIGLFASPTTNYFGQFPPAPDYDGVYWLNKKAFLFNLCSGTIAPITSGIAPCDTFKMCVRDSVLIPLDFLAPLQGDSVWANISFPAPSGVSIAASYPGPTDSMTIKVVGSASNFGNHVINVYAYDNQTPRDTTYVSFVIQVDSIAPTATLTAVSDSICKGDTSTLTITAASATYLWSTGATTSSIKVNPVSDAAYSVNVRGSCGSASFTKLVKVFAPQKPVVSGTSWKCSGNTDTLRVSGSTSYLWDNGTTETTYITGKIQADSTMSVIGYNAIGCPDTSTYSIVVRIPPGVTIPTPALACAGTPATLTANATGTGPYTYIWSPGGGTTSTITISVSEETYTVIVSNGCKTTKTIPVKSTSPDMTACCSKTIILGDDTIIKASGSSITHYQWQASDGSILSCDTCPSITVKPTVTTSYTVTGTDSLGCQTESVVTINVEVPCFNFTVPNVITPNGDGHNDVLAITTQDVDGWSMQIFDRWGKEVFKSTSSTEYWAGTTESGAEAPDGVYYYIVEASCQGATYKKDGFVQLIR